MEQYDDRMLLKKGKINVKRGGKSTVDGKLKHDENELNSLFWQRIVLCMHDLYRVVT